MGGPDYKTLVEQISYKYTRKVVGEEVTVCFFDMKTLYFEAAEEDELRKCGFSKDGSRLVVSSGKKRAAKDRHNCEKGLARLQKRIRTGKLTNESINNRGYNKYLRLEGEMNVSIDLKKYEADAEWGGINGYEINTALKVEEVIERYSDFWYIERVFYVKYIVMQSNRSIPHL